MKRNYKKRPRFETRNLGGILLTLFVIFIAFRILTPPSEDSLRITAPDGSKTARLKTEFYFDNQPSYKIYYRERGKNAWMRLYYLPAYTNVPADQAAPDLKWSPDSDRLDFLMNGTSIWHHAFAD